MNELPAFVADSELLASAYLLARSAHHGPAREGDTDISHPVAVAELLKEYDFEENVVAAALLHDVVEDTSLDIAEIEKAFGGDVARLVAEMTEDASIESYEERKAEHRSRVAGDRRVAAIYAADKLATTRDLAGAREVPPEKLEHYRQTLRMLCEAHPDLPFLGELGDELTVVAASRRSD
jgi:GTP diphosphokinase / guanosine-3',5'-bis(diphosphate) 3'-diphosphatase